VRRVTAPRTHTRVVTVGAGASGLVAALLDLGHEVTITADGAFWGSFGPTVRAGRLDTDLLLTRTILPLSVPAHALLGLLSGMPRGHDTNLGIR
jgi:hypothetical protein